MIIDMHFHTNYFSECSIINPEEGVRISKESGLDGICITEHDEFFDIKRAYDLQNRYNILVIVGVEILTYEGDILCFGLDKLPNKKIHVGELVDYVYKKGGITIAAHPFRLNKRGIGEYIKELPKLDAVETLNGNTKKANNIKAFKSAENYKKTKIGGSDAHDISKIGSYATYFKNIISSEKELIREIKSGNCDSIKLKNC